MFLPHPEMAYRRKAFNNIRIEIGLHEMRLNKGGPCDKTTRKSRVKAGCYSPTGPIVRQLDDPHNIEKRK